jgi:phosphohistidine phosphatase
MLLLLVRHAHAGDRDPAVYPDDRLREVTDKGRKTHKEVSRWLGDHDLSPAVILASPWTRAWQTAEIVAQQATRGDQPIAVVECAALAAAPVLGRIQKAIESTGLAGTVALVGHEPWMGELASLLLAGSGGAIAVDFPKSGVMGIALDRISAGQGLLRFLLRPKML